MASIDDEYIGMKSPRDEVAVLDGIAIKGRIIIIPTSLQKNTLDQFYINHIGIENMRLLTCKSIYWISPNADIEDTIKNFPLYLNFQAIQSKDRNLSQEISEKLWKSLGTDIFSIYHKHSLCIVDYHSKLPVMQQMEGLSADNLIETCNFIYSDYGLPRKIVSDVDTNFLSETFQDFYWHLNIHHAVSSSYNHQSTDQIEAYIKFVERTMK